MNYLPRGSHVCHTRAMHLHEFQAKQLFSDYGIAVPAGQMLDSSAGVAELARQLAVASGSSLMSRPSVTP